jgi:hypothetical protein
VRGYGQAETSIAAADPYVVEAWNDATGLFSPCPSPQNKEELTGLGFSADGGASFQDLGALPNSQCNTYRYFGDPSVEAWHSGGSTYFYISSLYLPAYPLTHAPPPKVVVSYIALTACTASGTGAAATLTCSQPILAAQSTECITQSGTRFCSFLDKEFLTLDPQRGRLYVSYTDFGFSPNRKFGQIELAVCDIGKPDGSTGPAGGTAAKPVCTQPSTQPPRTGSAEQAPYFVVAPGGNCEQEGSYPAVAEATGDVYVAWESNWYSNRIASACQTQPTQKKVALVPFSCLTLTPSSACGPPSTKAAVPIVSMDAAFVPGYSRFPMNDFPRIAVSEPSGTVSIVWNDARRIPTGDILLQSYTLGGLAPVQSSPIRVNGGSDDQDTAWHFLPALRYANQAGLLNVSWYDRRLAPSTGYTDVFAALNVNPRTTLTPPSDVRVTTVSSNWNAVSSDIVPNFGVYTDNYVRAITTAPYHDYQLYVAWSDGRLGVPQPFEANIATG